MPASGTTFDADTGNVETPAGIPLARVVSQGVNPNGIVLGGVALPHVKGVTYRDAAALPPGDSFPQGTPASIMARGDIWVDVADPVAVGDPVTFSPVTGRLGVSGGSVLPYAKWVRGIGQANGLALLRLNLP